MPSQLHQELCPICKEKNQFQFIEDYSEDKNFLSLWLFEMWRSILGAV